MAAANPVRRSFALPKLEAAGARFEALGDFQIAVSYRNAADEMATAKRMGLADLSPLPRVGFKGAGTCNWLQSRRLKIPEAPNRAAPQTDGALALRLAREELLLLGGLAEGAPDPGDLCNRWQVARTKPRGYPLPRQETHAWFLVSGEAADSMLAKLCGVDLRPAKFANLTVAQTSLARVNGVICRQDLGATLVYHLLADSASACYLWDCLLDAMTEFQGGPVGLTAVRALPAT
ncbi:MAG: sarcosine oxidase [Rhodospirillales bacterium]|nr:sarcosine oxidase [Rhodospirillales bacterium]